jgi:O-methyltransferase involved in polyketide biosynthesis
MGDVLPAVLSGLSSLERTALIPLVARARARALFPELGFVDEQAENLVEALGVRLDSFGSDRSWLRGTVVRTKWIDDRCREFFENNPDGLGVALGAGLDTRYQRLNESSIHWVDLDLPEVTALKCLFVEPTEHYRIVAGDVTTSAWFEQIGWRTGMPIMIIAEGLLMYLAPHQVRRLFMQIEAYFSNGDAPVSVLFDYASPLLVINSRFHPALMHTDTRFRWGLAGAKALSQLNPSFEVVEDYDVSQDCGFPTSVISMFHQLFTLGQPFYGLAHVQLRR